jgi:hypothetical protein
LEKPGNKKFVSICKEVTDPADESGEELENEPPSSHVPAHHNYMRGPGPSGNYFSVRFT